jgi:prepilin-type N-terminal cleavage/methylation domain-containing protein
MEKIKGLKRAFSLAEVLAVVVITAILAAMLFPVLISAKAEAKQTACISNLHQIGAAMELYLADSDGILPDRRDLKRTLPGGFKPWSTWPTSDPRCGWAAVILEPYTKSKDIWICPSAKNIFEAAPQVKQKVSGAPNAAATYYWMWRFDQAASQVPLDDFWGKSEDQAVADLIAAKNPTVAIPQGTSDVELLVDPYFPSTVSNAPSTFKGRAVHFGGRNRLFLDCHAKFLRDQRTNL